MEQTTLQQRIEERAKQKLLKDLLQAAKLEGEIRMLLGPDNFPHTIEARELFGRSYEPNRVVIESDHTQELFDKLLPKYITRVTDEILGQIDQVQYLLHNKDLQQQDY